MRGVVCGARRIKTIVDVDYSVRCQYGVPLKILKVMPGNYGKRSMGVYTTKAMQMNKYEFTLTFALQNAEDNPEQFLDALYEAGCDDALIGTGQPGSIALEFMREAKSAAAAVN